MWQMLPKAWFSLGLDWKPGVQWSKIWNTAWCSYISIFFTSEPSFPRGSSMHFSCVRLMESGPSSAQALGTHPEIQESALALGFFYKAVFTSQEGVWRTEAKPVLGSINRNCSHVCLQQAAHRAELEITVLPFQGTAGWEQSFSTYLDPCCPLAGLCFNKTSQECEYWTA